MNKEIVNVRFSPSPSGILHLGSSRTAITNYIFKQTMAPGSKFYLRIEDTDKERSTEAYINVIYENLNWLGIQYDDEPVIQSHNLSRHAEVANELLQSGNAYYCFCSQDVLEAHRTMCKETNAVQKYSGKCRCLTDSEVQSNLSCGMQPTIRIKVPEPSTQKYPYIVVNDMIKGKVQVHYNELDDFIILRSDGSPTYMLSVVVDDHDMKITHVIRGDDHFTNTFRQICIYNACQWVIPKFGHLPLIFGDDGKKLSKRRQVVGINDFRELGYTSEALRLYIGTMGYTVNLKSVTFEEILRTFNIKKVSKSAVQFDINFLNIINQQVIKSDKKYLLEAIPFIQKNYHGKNLCLITDFNHSETNALKSISCQNGEISVDTLDKAYSDIASRSKTLVEFADISMMYLLHNKIDYQCNSEMLSKFIESFRAQQFNSFDLTEIKTFLQGFIVNNCYSNEDVYSMLRLCLTGLENTPNVCNIMYALGYQKCLERFFKFSE